jgi:predicted ATPase
MAVYAVQGLRRRHAGVSGWGARAPSPFVGRERELALLQDSLVAARAGQGQVVGVVGEAGMGKTRLVTEFGRRLADRGVTVVVGHCLAYGQHTPYLPVRDFVRQLGGLRARDTAVVQTAAVERWLHAAGVTVAADGALLRHLLDLPVAPEALAQLSPEARQVRTFALLRHLVVQAAQQQPLVLVVENLHWIDPTSAAWLLSLMERLADAALLLVGTCRPGAPRPWGVHAAVTQMALSPLRDADSRAVVQAVPGAGALSEARLRAIVARAGGNPFFVEELVWDAVEQDERDTPGTVPATVHAVLAARIDRLPPEAKRLLQIAAVIGPEVPVSLLQALAEVPEAVLHHGLAHLQAAEFLYETCLFPVQVYSFKHALTHEVAYGSLLQERRRFLHARLVDIIEALPPNHGTEQVECLAHHALQGEVWDKALTYLRQAGRKAEAQSALLARGWFEQALRVLTVLHESPATLEQGFEIRLGLRATLGALGEVRQALEHLRKAETLAEQLHDDHRRGRVYASMTVVHVLLGELDEALAAGTQALEIARRLGDLRLRLLTTTHLEQAHYYRGDYHQVVALATGFLATLATDSAHGYVENTLLMSLYCRYWLILSLTELGQFTEATAYAAEAFQLAESTHHANFIGRIHFAAGRLHFIKGDWASARAHFEHGIVAYREGHIFLSLHHVIAASAWVLAQVGETSLSLTRLREGEQLLKRQSAREAIDQHGGDYHALGRAALLLGQINEAQNLGDHALRYAPSHPGFAAHALHLLGDIAMHPHHSNVERSEAYYLQALALAEQCSMRPLQAHCHRGLGTLYARTGQRQQAQAELTTAIDLYRAMDMAFWLPQAEATLAQIGKVDTPAT